MTEPQAPARRRKAARRSQILAAAHQVFAANAYEAASIGEIAARANCVEGTIYTYFRNKRELFDEVLAEYYDRLIADIEPRLQSIRSTRDRLFFLVARHLQIAVDDPGVSRMIIRESRGHREYFGSKLHALNRRYSQLLLRTLAQGIERGELRADLNTTMARDMLFGGLEHLVWNELGRNRRIDAAGNAEQIVKMMLAGWAPPQSQPVQAGALGDDIADLRARLERIESTLTQKRIDK
jgi:AcrR family transcriptional regulator